MTALIVTADDVGLHRGMTEGAVKAHRDGIVTACSVAATGRALAHAHDELDGCADLDVGIHLVLVGERPVREARTIPSLVSRDGAFPHGHREFAGRYALGLISLAQVEDEWRGQIERLLRYGFRLSHVNSHQHLHALPRLFEIAARLAREYGIGYVRVPAESARLGAPLTRGLAMAGLRACAERSRRWAHRYGRTTNDVALGLSCAGHLDTARLTALLERVEGLTELVTHPGLGSTGIAPAYDWHYDWDRETESLCNPRVRSRLAALGIGLTRPSALAPAG